MSWPPRDFLAVTLDGALLVNVRALHPKSAQLRGAEPAFVGARLTKREVGLLRQALIEAAAEAVAKIDGARRARRRRS